MYDLVWDPLVEDVGVDDGLEDVVVVNEKDEVPLWVAILLIVGVHDVDAVWVNVCS